MTQKIEESGPAYLFCPGNRPERFVKAIEVSDVAVLDLEDGVGEADKDMAREAVVRHMRADGRGMVRINLPGTDRGLADAESVARAGARLILLPKTESATEIDSVAKRCAATFIATIETARGLMALEEIAAHPSVAAISWGPYDLAADMGLRAVRDDSARLLPPLEFARNCVLIATAAAGKMALDTVTSELNREDVIAADATEAALLGFCGKFSIHPKQVPVIRAAFRPDDAEVERSRRMLDAAEGRGAVLFEGEMVDGPMLHRARGILAAANAADQ